MEQIPKFLIIALEIGVLLFAICLVLMLVVIGGLYVVDRNQTSQAIRRNYPVIGRFRYLFEHLGEFFRQYFFAMDREELPFNRAQRSWCYRAAKNVDNTTAFGSTRDLKRQGAVFFVNCPYPTLSEHAVLPKPVTIGMGCRYPFEAKSMINISGMSFGAISKPAVTALSNGARMAGCWLNTGEGGLSPYHLAGGADIVFQMGTAKNGVRDLDGNLSEEKLREVAAHDQVKMFEIKLSQGAKPGKGGILPGEKVNEEIAAIRNVRIGEDAISPNRHPDIDNNEQLLDMIGRLRDITGKPVGFKCVLGAYGWLDSLFEEINLRGLDSAPDFITLDSADGGTGAAPLPLIDDMGLPLRESLPVLVDKLIEYDLRDRIKVIASGKLITPTEVAWALCIGADFIVSARGFMFSLGCIQSLQCNKNTCPTGITTHDPKLQRGLVPADKAERVANYCRNLQYEVGIIAHSCGVPSPRSLQRFHARMVTDNGKSVPLNELYPESAAAPSEQPTRRTVDG
ncbi:MAG: FMN-binding glutamate synthase family protein [Gammaproteobacteria bacterium]